MREVGVRFGRGKQLTPDERNEVRQKADCDQRRKSIGWMAKKDISCSIDDLLVLAQPMLDDQTDLYWKSIEDFFVFAATIAGKRENISGESLIQLFASVKPSIMNIQDFSNPKIPFERIMTNIAIRYLEEASGFAIGNRTQEIFGYLSHLSCDRLRAGLNNGFVQDMVGNGLSDYRKRAGELFPGLVTLSPPNTKKFQDKVEGDIAQLCVSKFIDRVVELVIPVLQEEVFQEIKDRITIEMRDIAVADVGKTNFTQQSSMHDKEAEMNFSLAVGAVREEILSLEAFAKANTALRGQVSNYFKELETARKQEYKLYCKEKEAKRTAIMEREYQLNVVTLGKEQAEALKLIEEERIKLLHHGNDQLAREGMFLEGSIQNVKRQIEAEDKHRAAMIAMRDKAQRERDEMVRQFNERRQAIEREEARRWAEERQRRDASIAELERQIHQLRRR
jgi:hypothetical protein